MRLVIALQALKQFCDERGVKLSHSDPKDSEYNNVLILRANNKFGSIGIGPDNELRCFTRDNKKYRWAKLEGFKEKEIYEKLGDEMLEEVSLEVMAEHFAKR